MYEVPIEKGKVREFARSTLSRDDAHEQMAAVIPPTFLTTAANFWAPRDGSVPTVGFDPKRLLHGEEEYIFHGPPPRVGQTLQATTRLGESYEKAGKRGGRLRFGELVTEFRDGQGTLVAEQRTTLVETSVPPTESR